VTAVAVQLFDPCAWNSGCCDFSVGIFFFVGALDCPCCRRVGHVWFRQNCMIKMYTYRRIPERFGMCSDITYSPINSVDFDCRYSVLGGVYTLVAAAQRASCYFFTVILKNGSGPVGVYHVIHVYYILGLPTSVLL
jgi:hypothetical protein